MPDTLARRSELVAMRVQDVAIGAEGHGTVTIRRGKTDQEGIGSERYLAPDTSRLIVAWLEGAKILGGTLFRAVLRGGKVGGVLEAGEVARVFKGMAAAAGVPADQMARISAHSSRIGAAQDMAASDRIELPAIMQAGGGNRRRWWRSTPGGRPPGEAGRQSWQNCRTGADQGTVVSRCGTGQTSDRRSSV